MELPPSVVIGKNSYFMHNGLGCVIHAKAIIGSNVRIYQNVTIGGRNGLAAPVIKNNTTIGAGACILGKITIGEFVQVGANAVVLKDIQDGKTVIGIPAKEIKNK
jgi:serine O-acetyltransferase